MSETRWTWQVGEVEVGNEMDGTKQAKGSLFLYILFTKVHGVTKRHEW